jgi:photosystem II stability/assembly factor-like uncharacterized protein
MTSRGKHQVLVASANGLHEFGAEERVELDQFFGREITALTRQGPRWWALLEGRTLWQTGDDGTWRAVATVDGLRGTCLASTPAGLLVGTESAHLLRLDAGGLQGVTSFDEVTGRDEWYTPWGDPADVRSIAADAGGAIYVNVHVGGVVRSSDGGRSWRPTRDIEHDVHQVLAHPTRPGTVLVAAAVGFGLSEDAGETWRFTTDGLHATYLRAVAVADDTVLVTASTGPGGRRAAIYRRRLDGAEPFERCRDGLPRWFPSNIDTACLVAAGASVVFGTDEGAVFLSTDRGERWEEVAAGLPPIHGVVVE